MCIRDSNTPNFESFICTIDGTYVEEDCRNGDGKIDYGTMKPVLFDFPVYEYLRTGDAVSYTHLDVYKRQDENNPKGRQNPPKSVRHHRR